jgi:hypothetical protein
MPMITPEPGAAVTGRIGFPTGGPPSSLEYVIPALCLKHGGKPVLAVPVMRQRVRHMRWFRFFGGRQFGKSTTLRQLQSELNGTPDHVCILVSFQSLTRRGRERISDEELDKRIRTVFVDAIDSCPHKAGFNCSQVIADFEAAERRACSFTKLLTAFVRHVDPTGANNRAALSLPPSSSAAPAPGRAVVVAIDEFDRVQPLESAQDILDTLRAWYHETDIYVPRCMILCGALDVTLQRSESDDVASPFNVADALFHPSRWGRSQLTALVQQHANAHGVAVEGSALDRVLAATSGQPWQTNKVLEGACFDPDDDTVVNAVTEVHVNRAISRLLSGRTTHFQGLMKHYRTDPRIRDVSDHIASGGELELPGETWAVALELGLVRETANERGKVILAWASQIVEEVMARCSADTRWSNPAQVHGTRFNKCFPPRGPRDWLKLLAFAVDANVIPAVGTLTNRRNPEHHRDAFRLMHECFFQHHVHAECAAIMNGHGVCVREFHVLERRKCDHLFTLFGSDGEEREEAAVELKLAKPSGAEGEVNERVIDRKMEEAVVQLEEAFGARGSIKVGVAVVFVLSDGPLTGAKVFHVLDPLPEERTDGKTVHRVVVRINTKAIPERSEAISVEDKDEEEKEEEEDTGVDHAAAAAAAAAATAPVAPLGEAARAVLVQRHAGFKRDRDDGGDDGGDDGEDEQRDQQRRRT